MGHRVPDWPHMCIYSARLMRTYTYKNVHTRTHTHTDNTLCIKCINRREMPGRFMEQPMKNIVRLPGASSTEDIPTASAINHNYISASTRRHLHGC